MLNPVHPYNPVTENPQGYPLFCLLYTTAHGPGSCLGFHVEGFILLLQAFGFGIMGFRLSLKVQAQGLRIRTVAVEPSAKSLGLMV